MILFYYFDFRFLFLILTLPTRNMKTKRWNKNLFKVYISENVLQNVIASFCLIDFKEGYYEIK